MTDHPENIPTTNADDGSKSYATHSPLADKKNTLLHSMAGEMSGVATTAETTNTDPLQKETLDMPVDLPPQRVRPEGLVHTFKNDVQDLIKEQKLSMTKIRAIESDSDGREVPMIERTESNNGGALMLVAGVVAALVLVLGGAYYYSTTLVTPRAQPNTLAYGLFFTEGYEPIDITNKVPRAVREAFAVVRKRGAFSLGSVIELVPTVRIRDEATGDFIPQRVASKDLMRALGAHVPTLFTETLGPLYMVGIHVGDENIPYIVLTTTSYDYAFSGMVAWERSLEEDLAPFMSPGASYTPPASTQGGNVFIDTVVRNYDLRILRDDTGEIRLLYGFADRSTIVITPRVETFIAIAERLQVEKQ